MTNVASKCFFLFFMSLLTVCTSGTLVGFSYNARENTEASSLIRTTSFLELNKASSSQIRVLVADHRVLSALSNSSVSVDLHLSESLVGNLLDCKSFFISWLETHVVVFLTHVNIRTITVSGSNHLSNVIPALKSIHSVLRSFDLDNEVKVSVEFSLSYLEKLDKAQENDLSRICGFIRRIRSFVTIEASLDSDVGKSMGEVFFTSMIRKITKATSLLPCNDVPIVMTIKSLVPSAKEVAEFSDRTAKYLENNQIVDQVAELYADVSSVEDFATKELKREHGQIVPSSRRELLNSLKTTLRDTINAPVVFPTNPVTTPPVTLSPDNPTPTIVTIPATNPGTTTPTNPASTPLLVPTTAPVTFPPPDPAVNPPVPITNPVTTPAPVTVPGAQPITNPVTTYPAPSGNVPVVTPVTNPVAPPATTNAPAIPGQSWCIAKTGTSDTTLQSALDYACGIGGADCSLIQQGGSCYNPNTLQNHASYAFNSYYQKNPVASSCEFGGTAVLVNTNPSTGSCIYASSSSGSSLPTPSTTAANPATITTSPPVAGGSSTDAPPSVLNSSSPAGSGTPTVFGTDTPPGVSTSPSKSATFRPFIGHIVLASTFVVGMIALDM